MICSSIVCCPPPCPPSPRTFNPADYTEASQTDENYGGGSTWNNTGGVETEEGAREYIEKTLYFFMFLTGSFPVVDGS